MQLTIDQAMERALAAHNAGDLSCADSLYRGVLAVAPSHADAWHLWGAAAFQAGDYPSAVERMRQAVALRNDDPQFLGNLGLALGLAGRPDEAERWLLAAIALRPDDADLWFKLANARKALRRDDEAESDYRRALSLAPQMAAAHGNLAALLVDQGRFAEAIERLRQGLELAPGLPELHCNMANAQERLGDLTAAEACYRRLLQIRPDDVDGLLGLAGIHLRLQRPAEAEQACRRVLAVAPRNARAWRALGGALSAQRRPEAAEQAICESLRLAPDAPDSLISHCVVLHDLGRLDEAIAVGRRAVERAPDAAAAHDNLGAALARAGQFDEALVRFRRAIELEPKNAMAHFHLALTLMLLGDYEQGWREYEWRFQHPQSVRREVAAPRWQGEPLDGRTILLQSEQGFGDTLHFVRYARLLRQQGARVLLECSPALIDFLNRCDVVDGCVPNDAPLPRPDFHCPLLSLGERLQITPPSPALPPSYLKAEPERVAAWKSTLERLPGLRIGVAWQGDPKHTWDRFRSLGLAEFAPLAAMPGVTLVSLQRGPGEEQLAQAPFPIVGFAPPLDNSVASFRDTAAVMKNLDLVLCADTAVAHLAGGLGVPTWLLLNAAPDWRWGLAGESTPWYPSFRLLRQSTLGDWRPVFARVAAELTALAGARQRH